MFGFKKKTVGPPRKRPTPKPRRNFSASGYLTEEAPPPLESTVAPRTSKRGCRGG